MSLCPRVSGQDVTIGCLSVFPRFSLMMRILYWMWGVQCCPCLPRNWICRVLARDSSPGPVQAAARATDGWQRQLSSLRVSHPHTSQKVHTTAFSTVSVHNYPRISTIKQIRLNTCRLLCILGVLRVLRVRLTLCFHYIKIRYVFCQRKVPTVASKEFNCPIFWF